VAQKPLLPIISLASKSTRRREILESRWGNLVSLQSSFLDADEPDFQGTSAFKRVYSTVCWKAHQAVTSEFLHACDAVIVADTLIEDPESSLALGQPKSPEDASKMLSHLIGRRHRVWTSTALIIPEEGPLVEGLQSMDLGLPECTAWMNVVSADVDVSMVSRHDLDEYVKSGYWRGKAGGYDADGAFSEWIEHIHGDRETVLGISTLVLESLEKAFDIILQ